MRARCHGSRNAQRSAEGAGGSDQAAHRHCLNRGSHGFRRFRGLNEWSLACDPEEGEPQAQARGRPIPTQPAAVPSALQSSPEAIRVTEWPSACPSLPAAVRLRLSPIWGSQARGHPRFRQRNPRHPCNPCDPRFRQCAASAVQTTPEIGRPPTAPAGAPGRCRRARTPRRAPSPSSAPRRAAARQAAPPAPAAAAVSPRRPSPGSGRAHS